MVMTAILFLFFSSNTSSETTLTKEEIIEQAKQYGLVEKNEEIINSEGEKISSSNQVEKEEQPNTPEENKQDNIQKEEDTEQEKETKQDEDVKKEEEKNEKITVTIKEGENSSHVASKLEKLGVIEDGEAFNLYLVEHGYAKKVQVGTFEIQGKPSYSQLANILAK